MNVTALSDACDQILQHAIDGLDQAGAPGAPGRAFVSAGDPDPDCELLAVYATPFPRPNGTASPAQNCAILHRAEIVIRYWTCTPKSSDGRTTVDKAVLDAHGHSFLDGLWAVWSWLGGLITTSTLVDDLPCSRAELINAAIDRPADGAGWTITLNLDLTPFLANPSS